MKLIVDIPDEYFEQIKNNTEGSTAESEAVTAIRTGVPYKEIPQGDLISREALKEELKQYFSDGVLDSVSAKLALNMVLNKIKDAPTVEPKQGEWVDVVNSEYPSVWHYECSECHGRPLCTPFTKEDFLSRFCPNCGSDMRGKDNG